MNPLTLEFERQIETLIEKKYPKAAGLSVNRFLKYVEPLSKNLKRIKIFDFDLENGWLPFVIVIRNDLVGVKKAMSLVIRENRNGLVKLYPREPKDFKVIQHVVVPETTAYLLVNVDRGKESRNIPPNEAIKLITKKLRSPLTIEEGIACVTQFPNFLMKNNCFSLLASRHAQDKRVPAIWINSKKNPNLGWCWEGNPHTWLGSASCEKRLGY